MKKLVAKISRTLADGHKQELGEFPFLNDDYFNLYHGMSSTSGLAEGSLLPWMGFKVKLEEDGAVIKKLLPPEENDCHVGVGQTCTFDFNGVGEYGINIISIDG